MYAFLVVAEPVVPEMPVDKIAEFTQTIGTQHDASTVEDHPKVSGAFPAASPTLTQTPTNLNPQPYLASNGIFGWCLLLFFTVF